MIRNEYQIQMKKKRRRLRLFFLGLIALAAAAFWTGRYPKLGWTRLADLRADPIAANLFWRLRIPRVATALMSGAMLGAGGFVSQNIFRNPLASPDFLGVSQGAAVGAAIAIVFFSNSAPLRQLTAFCGGACGLLLSLAIARRIRFGGWVMRLLLSGATVSAFFSGLLTVLKLVADGNNELHAIEFWIMGGYNYVTLSGFAPVVAIGVVSLIMIGLFRWRTNLFSLPEESALALGASLKGERTLLLWFSVLGISAVTSISGVVGWVGLLIPHLARIIFGPDSRFGLPGSMVLGALITLGSDTAIRLLSPREIPIGIVTAFFSVIALAILISSGKLRF